MDKWLKRTLDLGVGLALTGRENPSVVPYYPQKTEISGAEEKYFKRTAPENKGVSSGRLLAMLKEFEAENKAYIHSFMVLKDGEVICECARPGYSVNIWHLAHSMSKTLTGMATGILIDDGVVSLTTRLVDVLPEYKYNDARFERITVEHLLTMSTGVCFSETASVSESRWTENYFASRCAFEPGTKLAYNSMNSYILARILTKLTGKSLTAFLDERFFGPMQITNRFWELSPEGVEKGGWSLYLSAESWAKIGYMMLSGGVFDGKRILSEDWVRECGKRKIAMPESIEGYDYSYQMWASRKREVLLFSGMLGQNVIMCPKNNIVAVVLSGDNELFPNSAVRRAIEKYLTADLENDLTDSTFVGTVDELREAEEHFFASRLWTRQGEVVDTSESLEAWDGIVGRYRFHKNNVGVIPVFVRTMQNNFPSCIEEIGFERDNDALYFTYIESGVEYRLEVGADSYKESVIDFNGERYIVRAMGGIAVEKGKPVYKLELVFPELPNVRTFKLKLNKRGKLVMNMAEMPNGGFTSVLLSEIDSMNPRLHRFIKPISIIARPIPKIYFVVRTFAPKLVGARVDAKNHKRVMRRINRRRFIRVKAAALTDVIARRVFYIKEDHTKE